VGQALDQPLVLVVDDDHDLCANLWDLLREGGYRVAVAHNEREATAQLAQATFRVVLIDMKLPEANGAAIYRLVRQANPQARAVVITGHRSEMEEQVRQILEAGAEAVCYKPFDVPHLLDTLMHLSQERTGSNAECGMRNAE
jgi:two-component system response regulator HydG